jgi:hypothetical protein
MERVSTQLRHKTPHRTRNRGELHAVMGTFPEEITEEEPPDI